MRTIRTKVLGCVGLALVLLMTLMALVMPVTSDDAAAFTDVTSAEDTLSVTTRKQLTVNVKSPEKDGVSISPVINFDTDYAGVVRMRYILIYGPEGSKVEKEIRRYCPIEPDGICRPTTSTVQQEGNDKFVLDLRNFVTVDGEVINLGYEDFTLKVAIDDGMGNVNEDIIQFAYSPISIAPITEKDEKDNPVVVIDHDDATDHVDVVIKDKDGKVVYGPRRYDVIPGQPLRIDDIHLEELGLEPGEYTIGVTAYDKDGKQLFREMLRKFIYNYRPEEFDVPNTGGIGFLKDTIFSKTDFALVGVVAFLAVGGLGVFLIVRKRARK